MLYGDYLAVVRAYRGQSYWSEFERLNGQMRLGRHLCYVITGHHQDDHYLVLHQFIPPEIYFHWYVIIFDFIYSKVFIHQIPYASNLYVSLSGCNISAWTCRLLSCSFCDQPASNLIAPTPHQRATKMR